MIENADHLDSVWAASAPSAPPTEPLHGTVRADVAVVGAGYTGLSAALRLAERGTDVAVMEAEVIGYGGSGRNSGLVNAGVWLRPDEVLNRLGSTAGERLNEALSEGPALVFSLVEQHGIDCEASHRGTLHLAHSGRGQRELEVRYAQWRRRGADVELLDRATTEGLVGSASYHGALLDRRAGTIQPLGYVRGLARAAIAAGARIYEQAPAHRLKRTEQGWRVETQSGYAVEASRVIVATNAYSDDLWPGLATEIYPVRHHQLASEPLGENVARTLLPEGHGAWDTHPLLVNIRLDASRRLIVGTIGNFPFGQRALGRAWAERVLARRFPQIGQLRWAHAWTGTLAFTRDNLPRVHELAPGVVSCIGYNGRGIAPGTVMGRALADWMMDDAAPPLPVTALSTLPFARLRSRVTELGCAFGNTLRTG